MQFQMNKKYVDMHVCVQIYQYINIYIQKAFSKLLTLKFLGLSDRDLNMEAPCTKIKSQHIGHIKDLPMPFAHWASVRTA